MWRPLYKKWAPRAHFKKAEMWYLQDSKPRFAESLTTFSEGYSRSRHGETGKARFAAMSFDVLPELHARHMEI
jgi:hypothetical protein